MRKREKGKDVRKREKGNGERKKKEKLYYNINELQNISGIKKDLVGRKEKEKKRIKRKRKKRKEKKKKKKRKKRKKESRWSLKWPRQKNANVTESESKLAQG